MITMKKTNANKHQVILQQVTKNSSIPSRYYFRRWISTVLAGRKKIAEVVIRIVDEAESKKLNLAYRNKNKPTNVLSFPFEPPLGIKLPLLGDLIICAPIIIKEAQEQNKPLIAHWAHMVIHGTLHLLGYDHIKNKDAVIMEEIEVKLLKKLGYQNPY